MSLVCHLPRRRCAVAPPRHASQGLVPTCRWVLSCLLLVGLTGFVQAEPPIGPLPTDAVSVADATTSEVPSPEAFLGRPVGTDFELADWTQVSGYYRQLAESSPRVELRSAGLTSEGRDFLYAIISDEENLGRLDEIREHARIIADPRGVPERRRRQAIRDGKVIVFVTPTMHATETAATEMGMQFAWSLATSDEEPWRTARKRCVVVITPSLNPDGVDIVVDWYRQHVGTPLEGTELARLYQLYTGHDNNRDWFMLTQVETRHLTRLLYREWFPQFLWDVHQQGNTTERFFVPPYRDPLNPNLDPGIVAGINLIGTRAVMDMTREGFTGIASGISYDNWWNGGNRSVPARHNVIGILTEAASVKIASPIFQTQASLKDPLGSDKYQPSNQFIRPWPGGWWRLRDIIAYELAFGRSLLGSVSREPQYWLRNAMDAAQRNLDAADTTGPRGWLIPIDAVDLGATRRLLDVLIASGVEIHRAENAFRADGREYSAGTVVIRRDQPYGGYVKDLFELQSFPPGIKPYDVTGWTLPLLLGVRRVEIRELGDVELTLVENPRQATESFAGDPRLADATDPAMTLSLADSDSWTELVKRLAAGQPQRMLTQDPSAGLVVPKPESSEPYGIDLLSLPRIGLYSPWSSSMDEGWLRWVLEHFEIPYTTVRNESIRAGDLNANYDVLVIPSLSVRTLDRGRAAESSPWELADGLDPEGSLAVQRFVRGGGRLVVMDNSAAWAINLFRLPVIDVTRAAKGLSCPGSVLRGVVEPTPLTAGLPDDLALFFSSSSAYRVMTKSERDAANAEDVLVNTLLRYAPNKLLLSGFLEGGEVLENQSAWLQAEYGDGQIHLFGFRPHYRAWSQATFHLLFRSLLIH